MHTRYRTLGPGSWSRCTGSQPTGDL